MMRLRHDRLVQDRRGAEIALREKLIDGIVSLLFFERFAAGIVEPLAWVPLGDPLALQLGERVEVFLTRLVAERGPEARNEDSRGNGLR